MISFSRLRERVGGFVVNEWILDSGAFSEVTRYKYHRTRVENYAHAINHWSRFGKLVAAITQDYMCEPWILRKNGTTVEQHQAWTINRYIRLRQLTDVYIMPVLQGYTAESYVRHLEDYGNLLEFGQWVGVGSICKRNSRTYLIEEILRQVKARRPDLLLHGFGLKVTSLENKRICKLLHSSDSMAWSFAARRKNGWGANDPRTARAFVTRIERIVAKHERQDSDSDCKE
jgi:hypothetical protein